MTPTSKEPAYHAPLQDADSGENKPRKPQPRPSKRLGLRGPTLRIAIRGPAKPVKDDGFSMSALLPHVYQFGQPQTSFPSHDAEAIRHKTSFSQLVNGNMNGPGAR